MLGVGFRSSYLFQFSHYNFIRYISELKVADEAKDSGELKYKHIETIPKDDQIRFNERLNIKLLIVI